MKSADRSQDFTKIHKISVCTTKDRNLDKERSTWMEIAHRVKLSRKLLSRMVEEQETKIRCDDSIGIYQDEIMQLT